MFLIILLPLFIAWLWIARWLVRRIIAGRIAEGSRKSLATWSTVLLMTVMIYQTLYVAWRNPFASDTVTLRGRFPFDQGYELVIGQSAINSYDWHQRLCGWFGTVVSHASCTGAREVLTPKRVDAKHYSLTLYRDYYFKGVAGWQLAYGYRHYLAAADPYSGGGSGLPVLDKGVVNYICSTDSQYITRADKLFCSNQNFYKKYKNVVLSEEQAVASNEYVVNFWLDSELDLLLKKGKWN